MEFLIKSGTHCGHYAVDPLIIRTSKTKVEPIVDTYYIVGTSDSSCIVGFHLKEFPLEGETRAWLVAKVYPTSVFLN